MTVQSGFFNSINGDRRYDARWFAEYFASFIGNGVFPNPSTGLQVAEGENMNIVVKPGKGWINGYFVVNDSDYILTLDNADGVLKRIDRVVMRLNYTTRQIEIDVKKGTFASNPVAPNLQRDTEFYELGLADILIGAGTTQISPSNITDLRLSNELCGIVHGVVDQVSTETLYQQYLDFWDDWRTQQVNEFEQFQTDAQAEFDAQIQTNQDAFDNQTIMNQQEFDDWFVTIQNILDSNVAGNLLTMINAINDSKGQPNGIATLDNEGFVPYEQLPNLEFIPLSQKGALNGVATLDGNGKLPLEQRAPISDLDIEYSAGEGLVLYQDATTSSNNANAEWQTRKKIKSLIKGTVRLQYKFSLTSNTYALSAVTRVLLNGTQIGDSHSIMNNGSNATTLTIVLDLPVNKNDSIEIQLFHNQGSTTLGPTYSNVGNYVITVGNTKFVNA